MVTNAVKAMKQNVLIERHMGSSFELGSQGKLSPSALLFFSWNLGTKDSVMGKSL